MTGAGKVEGPMMAGKAASWLTGAEGKYPDMEDSVYNTLYIVKITRGVPTVEIRE